MRFLELNLILYHPDKLMRADNEVKINKRMLHNKRDDEGTQLRE